MAAQDTESEAAEVPRRPGRTRRRERVRDGRPIAWRSKVPKREFVALLADGVRHKEIAARYGVSEPRVSQLVRRLEHADLLQIVLARPPAVVTPVRVTTLGPIDVITEQMSVLEELQQIRVFLASPEAAQIFRPATLVQLRLQTLDRLTRWTQAFMATRQQLAEAMGFEVWRRDLLALLEEEAPEVKARLLARIQGRVYVQPVPPAETTAMLLPTPPWPQNRTDPAPSA